MLDEPLMLGDLNADEQVEVTVRIRGRDPMRWQVISPPEAAADIKPMLARQGSAMRDRVDRWGTERSVRVQAMFHYPASVRRSIEGVAALLDELDDSLMVQREAVRAFEAQLADVVTEVRARGMTQAYVAAKLVMSPLRLSRLYAGTDTMRRFSLGRVAQWLKTMNQEDA